RTSVGTHDNSAPVSTSTDLRARRSPGWAGFSISTSTRKVPMSSDILPPEVMPSSTISLRRVSMLDVSPALHDAVTVGAQHAAPLHRYTARPPFQCQKRQNTQCYRSGTSSASTTVVTMLVMPTTASTGVQDLKVSS